MQTRQKPIFKSSLLWGLALFILFGTSFCKAVPQKDATSEVSVNNTTQPVIIAPDKVATVKQITIKTEDIIGVWQPQKEDFKVELYQSNDEILGKIVWMKSPNSSNGKPLLDKLNPQRNKRSQTILGMTVAERFEFNTYDKNWEDGMVYNPMTGETMKCTINIIDKNTLELVGFVGFSLSEVKIIWKKVDVE